MPSISANRKEYVTLCIYPSTDSHDYLKELYMGIQGYGFNLVNLRLRNFVSCFRCQVLHIHWPEYLIISRNRFMALLKFLLIVSIFKLFKTIRRGKILITLHNVIPLEYSYSSLFIKLLQLLLRFSDCVIVHNNYSKYIARSLYKINNIHVLPHPLFSDIYSPYFLKREKALEEVFRLLNIPRNSLKIVFVGNMRGYKDIATVLNAFVHLCRSVENVYLIVCGKASERVKKYILDYVRECNKIRVILKFVPHRLLAIILQAADLGILSYDRIWTSGTLMLYLTFGLPVIASSNPAIIDTLPTSVMYYRQRDAIALLNTLITAISTYREKWSYKLKLLSRRFNPQYVRLNYLKILITVLRSSYRQ